MKLSYILPDMPLNTGSPNGKSRVYFSSHPDDHRYLNDVARDIFRTHKCVIYYDENCKEGLSEEDKELMLGQMNLFVFPVTSKFLKTNNRARLVEYPFALSINANILFLMVESGLERDFDRIIGSAQFLYRKPDNSGQIAYTYADKLKNFLDSVFVGDELTKRIRNNFDAYIFLSYRKRDRKAAVEFMELVHKDSRLENVAVWYDEFLTPGENYNDEIIDAMEKSDLIAFVITPNFLEKDNYVQRVEYPRAVELKKPLVFAELEETDRAGLEEMYSGIGQIIDPREANIGEVILQGLKNIPKEKKHDPESLFLTGLAYYNGIDVELDYQKGRELMIEAALEDYVEAMESVVAMAKEEVAYLCSWNLPYYLPHGGPELAVYILERLIDIYKKDRKSWSLDIIKREAELASIYSELNIEKSLEIEKRVIEECVDNLGREDLYTIRERNHYVDLLMTNANQKNERAAAIEKEIIEDIEPMLADINEETYQLIEEVSKTCGKLEEFDNDFALIYARLRAILVEKQYGKSNIFTLESRGVIYINLMREKKLEEGKKLEISLYEDCKKFIEQESLELHKFTILRTISTVFNHFKESWETGLKLALLLHEKSIDFGEKYNEEKTNVVKEVMYAYCMLGDREKAKNFGIDVLEKSKIDGHASRYSYKLKTMIADKFNSVIDDNSISKILNE